MQVSTREWSHTRSSHNETVGITNLTPRHTNYFLVVQPYSKYIPVKLTPPSPHLVCFSQCFCSFRSNLHLKMFLYHPVWSKCNVDCSRMVLSWEHTLDKIIQTYSYTVLILSQFPIFQEQLYWIPTQSLKYKILVSYAKTTLESF